ncbi:ABC transporter permease [Paenibacillus agricola]|uniref:Sugar ABC transporter permease n=1 Tax=Paenibacillus agricola TaxID=2716264 RepID=A0ABX0J7N2_9BACL|nr:ABC transporter permease subunit [Paenibacillus agricola]NHN32147.1 sugar ABC transporter permease [Paenibacillus agricola]
MRLVINKKRLHHNLPLLLMFIPVILFYLSFKYLPMLGVLVAFKDYSLAAGMVRSPWVGLANFQMLFDQSQTLNIIRNTLGLSVLSLVFGFPVPVMLAIMLNEIRKSWFKRLVQTVIYLPHFLSWVVVGGLVLTLFSIESSVINRGIEQLFGKPYPFLYKPASWIAIFIASGVWKEMGFNAIIYLAALCSIDPSLYEAAAMDGAGKLRQLWHVTLPGIQTTMSLLAILAVGHVMDVGFDPVYNLQNDGVNGVSEVISTYVYRAGIQQGQFSLTAAMGLLESAVALVLVLAANGLARKYGQGLW